MLFNNPIFANWYTDTVDVYRTVSVMNGSITRFERTKINQKSIPCRILEPENDEPIMTDNAARERSRKHFPVIWVPIYRQEMNFSSSEGECSDTGIRRNDILPEVLYHIMIPLAVL